MEAAITKYDVQNGAFGIVMDVNTGEILAMATLGAMTPTTIWRSNEAVHPGQICKELYHDAAKGKRGPPPRRPLLDEYDSEVVKARLAPVAQPAASPTAMSRAPPLNVMTLAAALEEGAVTLNDSFYCGGRQDRRP